MINRSVLWSAACKLLAAGLIVGVIAAFSSPAQAASLTNSVASIAGTGTRIVVEVIPTFFESFDSTGDEIGAAGSSTEDKTPSEEAAPKEVPAGQN